MAIGIRCLLSMTLSALLFVAHAVRAETSGSELRWVSAAATIESAAADEPLPTPVLPTLEPTAEAPPPAVGGELIELPPNPYEAAAPRDDELPRFDADEYAYESQAPAYRPHHQPLATYLHNRPRQLPLARESWLNRPYAWSFLVGGLFLDNPLPGVLDGDPGIMFGTRLSWDFAPHWGVEGRFAFSYPGITNVAGAAEFPAAHAFFWDMNWLWYWTGDTRWRPYFTAGLGALDLRYESPISSQHHTAFAVPFGVGMKYRYSTRLAMRFDVIDNFSFNVGPQTSMHNLSITAGFEARFGGGYRRSYWPWNPGRDWR